MDLRNEIRMIESKSILTKLRKQDSFFGLSYNMNLYRGCQHGCIYCDTRSDCYGIGDISRIAVKKNALELLPKELKSKRKNKGTIGTGSMNDPYMPIEKELEHTRKALQIISDYKFPVHIITKSDLVVRDADILQDIAKTYAAVSFTITTFDDELSSKIEPNAPVSSLRFKAIEALSKQDIYVGITLMPLLPYINDTKENIETLMRCAKDVGASYVIPMFGLTMRGGSREYLYQSLEKDFFGLKEKYQKRFEEDYICNSPNYHTISNIHSELSAELQLPSKMKFYSPPLEDKQLLLFDS